MNQNQTNPLKKIVIVGGGFGGVRAALDLYKKRVPARIALISNKPYFEFHAALYRVVTGHTPLSVCIPLREIFAHTKVDVMEDAIANVDVAKKIINGASGLSYEFDFLILALGSQTAYFDIPGLQELSFSFKSMDEALRLNRHIHEVFERISEAKDNEEKVAGAHIIIIGAGPSGAELAGDLAVYAKKIACAHKVDPAYVTIDLIEAASRIVPSLPKNFSEKIQQRLRSLGINIFLNRSLMKEKVEEVYLKDMEIKVKTVIWAAGVKPNKLYANTPALLKNENGRVIVDEFLQAKGIQNVFVIGDGADTPYTGMAQTAIYDGHFAADIIARKLAGKETTHYKPKETAYALPIGNGWAAVIIGKVLLYGRIGWIIRNLADLRFFLSILPFKKALEVFFSLKTVCESCPRCEGEKNVS